MSADMAFTGKPSGPFATRPVLFLITDFIIYKMMYLIEINEYSAWKLTLRRTTL
jgi:hypothetical protein